MSYDEFLKDVETGKYNVLLFTQEHCKACETMKQSISEIGLPAYATEVTDSIIKNLEINVTPTLVITSNKELIRIEGSKSPERLKKILSAI